MAETTSQESATTEQKFQLTPEEEKLYQQAVERIQNELGGARVSFDVDAKTFLETIREGIRATYDICIGPSLVDLLPGISLVPLLYSDFKNDVKVILASCECIAQITEKLFESHNISPRYKHSLPLIMSQGDFCDIDLIQDQIDVLFSLYYKTLDLFDLYHFLLLEDLSQFCDYPIEDWEHRLAKKRRSAYYEIDNAYGRIFYTIKSKLSQKSRSTDK